MMLVGPSSNNTLEVTFTSCILFATVGVFAYFISNISMILEEMNQKEKIYMRDFKAINSYMRKKNIGKELQARVRNFLEYYFESHTAISSNQEIGNVLDKLPKNLHSDLK